jgi:hypothetical protein
MNGPDDEWNTIEAWIRWLYVSDVAAACGFSCYQAIAYRNGLYQKRVGDLELAPPLSDGLFLGSGTLDDEWH